MQLKRQQKVLREQEWNARPEWEKRNVVVSIDLKGGKAVRRMGVVEKPRDKEEEEEGADEIVEDVVAGSGGGGGGGKRAFGRNPLLGGLIRPVWKGKGEDKEKEVENEGERQRSRWRRVQDDDNDNEAWILDGGVYGNNHVEGRLGDEEHAFG